MIDGALAFPSADISLCCWVILSLILNPACIRKHIRNGCVFHNGSTTISAYSPPLPPPPLGRCRCRCPCSVIPATCRVYAQISNNVCPPSRLVSQCNTTQYNCTN